MTDISTSQQGIVHNVLVVGYQKDGRLIYMDPERGHWCTTKETSLKQDYKIVITNKKYESTLFTKHIPFYCIVYGNASIWSGKDGFDRFTEQGLDVVKQSGFKIL